MNFGKKFRQNLSEAPNGLPLKLGSIAFGLGARGEKLGSSSKATQLFNPGDIP